VFSSENIERPSVTVGRFHNTIVRHAARRSGTAPETRIKPGDSEERGSMMRKLNTERAGRLRWLTTASRAMSRGVAPLVVIGLVLAACGGDDESEAETPEASEETTPEETTPEETTPEETTPEETTPEETTPEETTPEETGVSPEWQSVVDSAAGQSLLVYHAASPEQVDRFIAAFNELYPDIDVTHERGGTPILDRLDTEVASGTPGGDILVYPNYIYFRDRADSFSELEGPAAAEFPADAFEIPGKVPLVEVLVQSTLMWNTNEFPDGFTSYEELVDVPSGRLALRNNWSGGLCAFYDTIEEYYGPEYIEGLGNLDPPAYGTTQETSQAVASGEVGVVPEMPPANVLALQEQGAPVDYFIVDTDETPGIGAPYHAGILAQSPNQEAAQLFVDFLLTPEGQVAWNGGDYGASVLDVEGVANASNWTLWDLDKYTPDAVAACEEKYGGVLFGQ
jgi:iron(III) transport system substrate-binding protein